MYCLFRANSRGVQNRSACQGWLVRPITRCISLCDAPKCKCTQSGGKNKKRSHEKHECAHGSCRTTFEGASVPALDQRAKRTRRKTRPKSLVRLADSSRGHVATRGSQRQVKLTHGLLTASSHGQRSLSSEARRHTRFSLRPDKAKWCILIVKHSYIGLNCQSHP